MGELFAKIAPIHFCALFIFTTWAFGGQAPFARTAIAIIGGFGVLLFILLSATRPRSNDKRWHPALRLLWPLWLYDALVIISCFNPNFQEIGSGPNSVLVMIDPISWLPSAALPRLAARELWQFNAIVLSCFNLYLAIDRRRHLRKVLFVIGANAVVLSIFGTFQKLFQADGLWFGAVKSPNPKFFSTFIYHNHWGSFILLSTCACLALLFHHLRRAERNDLQNSPVFFGAVITVLLAISIPLSESRSCTLLMGFLLLAAVLHFLVRMVRLRRALNESITIPVVTVTLGIVLTTAAAGYLGRNVIAQRIHLTQQQVHQIVTQDTLTSRLVLYRDTWTMAAEKPVFGWGLESYAHVFRVFNTQRTVEPWIWITFYAEAHNDWFQSLAEVGFVGTGLLALLLLVPLLSVKWRHTDSFIPRYLLAGCALVLLYAWLEFPFANPAVMLTFGALFYCGVRYGALDERAPVPAAK
jgi:O-antigen ligase